MKICKDASETTALLTLAYGEYTNKKLSVSEWHRCFMEGQEDVHDDPVGSHKQKGQMQT
jgi:hypothetical protein